jgi:FixJ family two-component response regulator
MERLHVNRIEEVLERSRRGQSDRAIAHDLGLSRVTVRKYRRAVVCMDEGARAGQLERWAKQERPALC